MLAVIKIGGLQHIVKKGDVIRVNKIDSEVGSSVEITDVLSIINGSDVVLGDPLVKDSIVYGKILEQKRDTKVIIFKKRRRKHSQRKNGHRQYITKIEITDIK